MSIDLSGRVAIVTGAGGGLGREHALLLARLGARVVVNDLGGDVHGRVASPASGAQAALGAKAAAGAQADVGAKVAVGAQAVVQEIEAFGGEAIANGASVTDFSQVERMVTEAQSRWGRIDILINNAGILRDKTFSKMTLEDFRAVVDVHLMGAVHCTKAVWDIMRAQNYGRIVMTTSSTGLYGNFGQSNYGAAKLALVGLMQTLALEGAKNNIRVNCIAPAAATRMLEGILPPDELAALTPAAVSPGVAVLVSEEAPTRLVLCAGAGSFEAAHITMTKGIHLAGAGSAGAAAGANTSAAGVVASGAAVAAELAARLPEVSDRAGEIVPETGFLQVKIELGKRTAR